MIKGMMKPQYKGQIIEIDLPEECGYENYFAECRYRYDKSKDKYLLSMWIGRRDVENKLKLSSKNIDAQYISGTKETIMENICRVVHQASLSGFFNKYVQAYEYELKCFDKGNAFFEEEQKQKITE